MLVYRIASPQYAGDLSGNGAKLYGGRWNAKGTAVVYLTSSRALAVMELLVHLRPEDLQRPYALMTFDVPDDKVLKLAIKDLPKDWQHEERKSPLHGFPSVFVEKGVHLLMEVPSFLMKKKKNYIQNP